MKRTLLFICGLILGLQFLSAITIPEPSWEPLPKTLSKNGAYDTPSTLFQGMVYGPVTHITVVYAHADLFGNAPRLVLEVDKVVKGKEYAGDGDSLSITYHVNLPARDDGYAIMIYGDKIATGHGAEPITILGIYLNGNFSRTLDIYYFANPKFASLRHEISASEAETHDRWRAHRIFTPGAWEAFCMPLPVDRVYTYEDNYEEVDLLPSTILRPDGHYWIRSFAAPCSEAEVGQNWLIPSDMSVPEAGVGYIFMLPDDPWWQGREICFEGSFVHGGGEVALTDEYSEATARSGCMPGMFAYVPNTTFLNQEVGEGWLPNVLETQGRYFDNHGMPYTLHPMECHLIGGSATVGIHRVGVRDTPTDIDAPSTFAFPLSTPLLVSESRPFKRLRNGRLEIVRCGRVYDCLGR